MPVEIDFYHFLHITKVLKQQKNFLKDIVVFTISTPGKQKIKNAVFLHCFSNNELLKIFQWFLFCGSQLKNHKNFMPRKFFCLKVVFYLESRP